MVPSYVYDKLACEYYFMLIVCFKITYLKELYCCRLLAISNLDYLNSCIFFVRIYSLIYYVLLD